MGNNNIGEALAEIIMAIQGGKSERMERVEIGQFTPDLLSEVRGMVKDRKAMEAEFKALATAKSDELREEAERQLKEYVDGLKDSEAGRRYDAEAERGAALLNDFYSGLENLPTDLDKDTVQFDIRSGVIFYEKPIGPANE